MKVEKIKIKPCPKCGEAWIYISDGDYCSGYEAHGFKVNCFCGFAFKTIPFCSTRKEAITKWNEKVEAMTGGNEDVKSQV